MDDTFQDIDLLTLSGDVISPFHLLMIADATSVLPQEVLTAWASGVVGMWPGDAGAVRVATLLGATDLRLQWHRGFLEVKLSRLINDLLKQDLELIRMVTPFSA